MKKNQVVENPPLMYIVQPNLNPIKSNMQHTIFVSKKTAPIEQAEQNNIKEDEPQNHRPNSNIPFHEMAIEHRIKFLLNLPEQYQNVKCEITSKEKEYIGKFIKNQNGVIAIQQFSNPSETIPIKINEIENIKIIDLNE